MQKENIEQKIKTDRFSNCISYYFNDKKSQVIC